MRREREEETERDKRLDGKEVCQRVDDKVSKTEQVLLFFLVVRSDLLQNVSREERDVEEDES